MASNAIAAAKQSGNPQPMRKEMQVSLAGLMQYIETGEVVTTTKDLAPTSLAAVD